MTKLNTMFSYEVNTVCTRDLWSPAKIRDMKALHVQMERLYKAARESGRLSGEADQTEMARLLNVAPQNVNNWEKRGPSKEALLDAQASFGVNATWVLNGSGPMFVGGAAVLGVEWPFRRLDVRRLQRLDAEDRAYVEGKLEAVVEAVEARIQAEKSNTDERAA